MKINNFDEIIHQIQAFLPQYLQEFGRDTSKMFSCVHPEHEDKHPSCSIGGPYGQTVFHCFSQGHSGDIFKAAHYLENKPIFGKEFITENLLYLAHKFGVSVESSELTEEEIYEMDTYRAYKIAHEYIINEETHSEAFVTARANRGWSEEICKKYGVGSVKDYHSFREYMKANGFPVSFLKDVDLNREELFSENHIIFTIKDEHARPVGFASRNLLYTEDKKNGSKFVNQKCTGTKCNIYKKGSRLFGIDQVIKNHPKKSDDIYIFEGYGDVVTAAQSGLTNSVAAGGTSFTVDQLQLLKDKGYYSICCCLDGDAAGQIKTAALLDTTFGGNKDVKVSVVIIPNGQDPDDFIKLKGIEKFIELKKYSAFEWRLEQFSEDVDGETVCGKMIPLIVNESSSVTQEKMIATLSSMTGVSIKAIHEDVNKILNSKEMEKQRARQNVLEKAVRNLQRNPEEAEFIIQETQTTLFNLAKQFDTDSMSEESCVSFLDSQKEYQETKTDEYMGFTLGNDLQSLQNALCGEWKKDVWITLGSKANGGKCISGDSLILNPKTGQLKTIEKIVNEKKADIFTVQDNVLKITTPSVFFDSGIHETITVTDKLGHQITGTRIHPVLTEKGWKKLEDITLQDSIASIKEYNLNLPEYPVSDEELRLAAYFLAENKKIPNVIFSLSDRQLGIFLGALWDCDGKYLISKDGSCSIEIETASKKINKDIQHLLIRLGIVSSFRKKIVKLKDKNFNSWITRISSINLMKKFIEKTSSLCKNRQRNIILEKKENSKTYCPITSEKENLVFVKVRSIQNSGLKHVYDLTVDSTHNFIANDLVVHNTSLLNKLAFEIAQRTKENNATVIYHSIDDTAEQIIPKTVCIAEGSKNLTINQVLDPNYHAKGNPNHSLFSRRNSGYEQVRNLMKDGRLIIKDANNGSSLAYAQMLITYYKNKYPSRNIVYILDNFHKLQDFQGAGGDERIRYKTLSSEMKSLATRNHICVISSVEYTKLAKGEKPSNNNISECLTGDTLIFNPQNGSYTRIDEISPGAMVATLNENQKISNQKITKVLDKGLQETFEVKTKTGRTLKTTMNHPFFGEAGWTKLSELSIGSSIAIPRKLQIENPKEFNPGLARLLGFLAEDHSQDPSKDLLNKKNSNILFETTDKAKENYLAGLFEVSGNIQKSFLSPYRITLSSKSLTLLEDAQRLLLHLGIQSSITTKNKTLTISDTSSYLFLTRIPIIPKNGENLEKIISKVFKNSNNDLLPLAFSKQFNTWIKNRNKRVSRQEVEYLFNDLPEEFKKWGTSDIYWDTIVSITPLGKQHCYDLTVENTHNFIANDIFCHNTVQMEYDANAIVHLYNDMHEMGEKATHYHLQPSPEDPREALRLPRIEVIFGKNKISGFKGNIWMDFFPMCSDWTYVDPAIPIQEIQDAKESHKKNQKILNGNVELY